MSLIEKVNKNNPYWNLLGIRLLELDKGYAKMAMPVKEELFQRLGTVHGGATASLIDSAVAASLITSLAKSETTTTIEMKINYLAPIISGELYAECKIIKHGRTIAVGSVNVINTEGQLVAIATATYMIIRRNSVQNQV